MAASLFLGGLAFLFAVVWGAPLIRLLRAQRIGKQIRIEGPQTHMVKAGTPTMGGLMIVVPVVVISGVITLINLLVEMNQGRPIANIGQQILVPVGRWWPLPSSARSTIGKTCAASASKARACRRAPRWRSKC